MALGGGTFLVQNKILPGTYINFVSAAAASATLSERGIATMPLDLDWGESGKVFEVTNEDFQKNCQKIFGYDYTHDKLKGLRDLFPNITTFYAYRLNNGGAKATCTYATAKYFGIRGNDIKIVIRKNADDGDKFDCITYFGVSRVDEQTVNNSSELTDNDYVVFNKAATLAVTAGTVLSGGTNGTITGAEYQAYLDKIESYKFNTMGVVTTEVTIKSLFASFCKRMRDEVGVKFQLVLHNYTAADYMGVISVKNVTTDTGWSEASLCYWVTGISAGCAVNKSNQNKRYSGEFAVNTDYTQNELSRAIQNGEFTLHNVDNEVRVLEDINTMTTVSDTMGDIFKDNQTVRVIDQIANDIAVIFATRYLGVVPNDESGRVSLWSDIVKHHQQLMQIRAIENFEDTDVVVSQGDTKKAVVVDDAVTVVNAMGKLYMTVTVA